MAKLAYLHRNGLELIICRQSTISYPKHNHVSVFTIGLVLDGAVELSADRGSPIYQKNGTFIVLPYTPHGINAKSCYTLLSLCISKEMMDNADYEKIKSDIRDFLRDAINQPGIENKMLCALHSMFKICRMMPAQKETAVDGLKRQLETHPEYRYSLDDMAKLAFISKYHLIRLFKRETGLTPHQFQMQNRIRKAQKLLEKSGAVSIAETALAAGFYDQSHFIRHFEKLTGLTPTDYRRSCDGIMPVSVP